MNRNILFFLLLLLIPVSQAAPPVTSYNGYVTVDSIPKTNALVKVLNSACGELASSTSVDGGRYQINVHWEDASFNQAGVRSGDTITILVDGKLAKSQVIDSKGLSFKLDLSILSSAATYECKTDGGNYATNSGGSSGGGGGSPVSAEPFENILKKESREESISKDAPRSYSFNSPELPVSQIVITSNINAGIVNVQVEVLKKRSTLSGVDAPGNVYKYLNIWIGSLGFAVPKNIKEGVVKYKLENSWITSNGFTDSDIKMLKWNGIEWITLATEKKNSDEKFTYYEANSTSFSPFAISGVKEASVTAASPEVVAVTAAATTGKPETPTPVPTKKAPGFGIVIALAGLTAVVLRKRSF
jgi:PGF-pre-PGF domain-containing protein